MRVLIITQNFFPEEFKANDIAFELVKRGYKVDALVGIPNYPKGKFFSGYGLFKRRIETINGVRIYRSFQISRGQDNKIRLLLNYLSFLISSIGNVLFLSFFKKYDLVIVQQTSPITQAIPAFVIKKIQGIPVYMWVLDIGLML